MPERAAFMHTSLAAICRWLTGGIHSVRGHWYVDDVVDVVADIEILLHAQTALSSLWRLCTYALFVVPVNI